MRPTPLVTPPLASTFPIFPDSFPLFHSHLLLQPLSFSHGLSLMSTTTRSAGTPPTPDSNSFADSGALVCADCQRPNAIERRYCTGCGAGLWAECPKCQAPHARSERFCGQCGLDIQRELSVAREQFEQRLGQARRFQEQLEFEEAQRALAPLLGLKDPRLAPLVEQARAASREFSAEQAGLQQQAHDQFTAAGRHAAHFAYERATAAIEAIPLRLRSAEITALLDDCRRRTREILGLSGEIRDLLAAKRGIEALPKLERLITLKPDHAEARKRIEQIVEKLLDAARKKLAARDYERAAELVRSIPPGLHDDAAREILAATADVEWLRKQLSRERLATPQLLALADRLATLCPNDAEVACRRAELAKVVADEPDQPRRGAAEACESGVSGAQVEWLAGSQRLQIADAARDAWRAHGGRFAVAVGLALQALGKAAIDLNLAPQEKKGLLGRLSFGRKKATQLAAWGLDLGSSALKAVKLNWDEANGVARVDAAELIELGTGFDRAGDEADVHERSLAVVRKLAARQSLVDSPLALNLPGLNTLGRWIKVPPVDGKKLDEMVKLEARSQIAMPLDELAWDYRLTDDDAAPAERSSGAPLRTVLLVAAKQHVVSRRLSLLGACGLKAEVLQCDGLALHNFAQFERVDRLESGAPAVLIDVGGDSTNLLVTSPAGVWFRTFGHAGDAMNQALSKELKTTWESAERLKRSPVDAAQPIRWAAALESVDQALIGEVRRSLAQYRSLFPGRLANVGAHARPSSPSSAVALLGGAGRRFGLLTALSYADLLS